MGRPQLGLPRLRVWATGSAIEARSYALLGDSAGGILARLRVVCASGSVVIFSPRLAGALGDGTGRNGSLPSGGKKPSRTGGR
jgi:hypothetical protein